MTTALDMDEREKEKWVIDIFRARKDMDKSTEFVLKVVKAARKAGCSWTTIGHGLGVSRQTAWQTWRHRVEG